MINYIVHTVFSITKVFISNRGILVYQYSKIPKIPVITGILKIPPALLPTSQYTYFRFNFSNHQQVQPTTKRNTTQIQNELGLFHKMCECLVWDVSTIG